MFRVPFASASAGAIGLGVPYQVRRGLIPVMAPPSAPVTLAPWERGTDLPVAATVPAEPAFRAPWGELERQLPYVSITTQEWPVEWWRPASPRPRVAVMAPRSLTPVMEAWSAQPDGARLAPSLAWVTRTSVAPRTADAIARATDEPADQIVRAVALPTVTIEPAAGLHELELTAGEPLPDVIALTAPLATPVQRRPVDQPRAAAPSRKHATNRAGRRAERRSLVGRVVLVAIGLVISLLAVESSNRRRR